MSCGWLGLNVDEIMKGTTRCLASVIRESQFGGAITINAACWSEPHTRCTLHYVYLILSIALSVVKVMVSKQGIEVL